MAPCGLILSSFGPIDGRRSDAFMLLASGIVPQLPQMADNAGTIYRIFGDSIYPMLPQLFRMFRAPAPGSPQEALNRVMSGCRVSVEWGFNLVTNTFQTVDFTRWNRMWMTNPSRQYRVATLLTNCLTCIRGSNQVAVFFQCAPPSVTDYLSGNW